HRRAAMPARPTFTANRDSSAWKRWFTFSVVADRMRAPKPEDTMRAFVFVAGMMAFGVAAATRVDAAEIKVLSAGAYKSVAVAVQPDFEKQTGHKLVIDNDTVGGLVKRIEGGEAFDVVIVSPGAVDDLIKAGKAVAGTRQTLARVGIGVMV